MVETLTVLNRRTLNFPAIQPCDEISPNTLLNSLIELAGEICGYKSKLFPSNNRNARASIRKIGVLLVFLEELRESAMELPVCVVLSFSELHMAFQKLRSLLEECSRKGARVWILVKSELVADQFRVLNRAISTALEIFPIDRIEIDEELKDHVQLVTNQARNSRFNVDLDDKIALQIINSVLIGFENGIIPNRNSLKLVLDHLGIRSWSKCHEEANFLLSEMEFEAQRDEKSDTSMLSSLMGLITYCRCAIFDAIDAIKSITIHRPSKNYRGGDSLIGIIKDNDDLRCPISLETMANPVTIASGQSYDRISIAKWFTAGNLTCPKTGEKVPSTKMVPNLAIRRLIQLRCSENDTHSVEFRPKNRGFKREAFKLSLAAKKAMTLTADLLTEALKIGTEKEKNKAAFEIRILSKTSVYNRTCLIDSGVIKPLLKLLLSSDSPSQENSSAALLNLSKEPEFVAKMFRNRGFAAIDEVLKSGHTSETRQHIAGVMFHLAASEENRVLIGENPGTISALIDLIKDGTERGRKNAMVAIFAILVTQENSRRVMEAGIVPLLVDLLNSRSDSEYFVANSLAILSILAERSDGCSAILHRGGLNSAVEILSSSDSKMVKEHCVCLVLSLCKNSEKEVVGLLVKSSSLMGSLYSVISEGTPRARKKASSLIRVLHEFSEKRSSELIIRPPILMQDRFVHAW